MSTNVINTTPYIRTSRSFPEDIKQLAVESNRAYIDIANAVNDRTISLYPSSRPAITGNNYYFDKNQRQQSFRQFYVWNGFPTATPNTISIPHGIDVDDIWGFVQIYGTFTDGTFWYTLPWVSVVDVTSQINIFITSNNIVITGGGGAGQPIPTKGTVTLEWASNP